MKRKISIIMSLALILSIATGCTNTENTAESSSVSGSNSAISESSADNLENIGSSAENAETTTEYQEKLFNGNVINIDITCDESDWQKMLSNAQSKPYISVDMNINGETFENVGIKPKGNSSLTQVVSSDSDRYSFKIKFDKYNKEQTCYGLDKLTLNSNYSDNTLMKEYISYDMMREMGVECPLVSYAKITVNGEYWGLYLALEAYDHSFLERNYGTTDGNLYNVKSVEAGGKDGMNPPDMPEMTDENGENVTMPEQPDNNIGGMNPPDKMPEMTDENGETVTMPEQPDNNNMGNPPDKMPEMTDENGETVTMPDFKSGGGFGNSGGGSLVYTDDDSSSYSSIFENAVFNSTGEEDYQRVITALKNLSEGQNLEEYFDVDEILRYLAVHTAVVNLDSYSSNMQQNYYIYENNGKITILPWDYNLAFGGFQSGSATSAVNFAIDTPVTDGIDLEDRPLISKLLEVDEYKERYHEYLSQVADYLNNIDEKVDGIKSLIDEDAKTDPSSFCTYEEFEKGTETLKEFAKLRAESIEGQLDGTVPSTNEEQEKDSSKLIDASSVNLNDMGVQGGGEPGKDFGGFGGGFGKDRGHQTTAQETTTASETQKQNEPSVTTTAVTQQPSETKTTTTVQQTENNISTDSGQNPPDNNNNGGQMPPDGRMNPPDNNGQMPQNPPQNNGGQMPPDMPQDFPNDNNGQMPQDNNQQMPNERMSPPDNNNEWQQLPDENGII